MLQQHSTCFVSASKWSTLDSYPWQMVGICGRVAIPFHLLLYHTLPSSNEHKHLMATFEKTYMYELLCVRCKSLHLCFYQSSFAKSNYSIAWQRYLYAANNLLVQQWGDHSEKRNPAQPNRLTSSGHMGSEISVIFSNLWNAVEQRIKMKHIENPIPVHWWSGIPALTKRKWNHLHEPLHSTRSPQVLSRVRY